MPNPSNASSRNGSLPDGTEIFRSGTHIDDSGASHSFSDADLRDIAAGYDPTRREAPLTVGHPEGDKPAYGFVRSLVVAGDRLAMNTADVEPQFAEMVRSRRFPKRSASFYPPTHPSNPTPGKWYLRHVAFLGAQPPAVAGLRDIAEFADDSDGVINFSEAQEQRQTTRQEPNMEKTAQQLQAELDAANQKIAEETDRANKAEATATESTGKLTQFAEAQRATRTAGFVSFAEAQFKAGKLRPADKTVLVATLEALADSQPVDFAEAGQVKKLPLVDWMKERVSGGAPLVQFGEHAPGNTGKDDSDANANKGLTDAELDAKAKTYARDHKVSYAEAIGAICNFTTS